jgi:hypothetical protein
MTVATQLAVFYATQSKILRRVVIPDHDAQLEGLAVPPGESVLWMQLDRPHDEGSCRAAIATATGVVPPSGRCCVVDERGVVIAVCNADPALDAHPQGWLVVSEHANPGDRYAGGVFLRESRVAST